MTRPPRISRTAARPIVCEFSMFSSSMLALSSSAAWVRVETMAASRWAFSRREASAAARPVSGPSDVSVVSRWDSGVPNPGAGSDVGAGCCVGSGAAGLGPARSGPGRARRVHRGGSASPSQARASRRRRARARGQLPGREQVRATLHPRVRAQAPVPAHGLAAANRCRPAQGRRGVPPARRPHQKGAAPRPSLRAGTAARQARGARPAPTGRSSRVRPKPARPARIRSRSGQ